MTQFVFFLLLFVLGSFAQLSLIDSAELQTDQVLLASLPHQRGAAWNLSAITNTIGFTANFQFKAVAYNATISRADGFGFVASRTNNKIGPGGNDVGVPTDGFGFKMIYFGPKLTIFNATNSWDLPRNFPFDENWHTCDATFNCTHVTIKIDNNITVFAESVLNCSVRTLYAGVTAATGELHQYHYIKPYITFNPIVISLTSSSLTTSPITSAELTTNPITSNALTTSPITSSEVTTSPITTSPVTTIEVTSGPVTSRDLTTNLLTTSAVTTISEQIDAKSTNVAVIAGAAGGGGAFILIVVLVVLALVGRSKKKKKVNESPEGSLQEIGTHYMPLTKVRNQSHVSLQNQSSEQVASGTTKNVSWEINYSELTLEKEIGRGGYVTKGKWRGISVAVKKLVVEHMKESDINDFYKEIGVMMSLKPHANVVQLYGVSMNPLAIITEFMAKGSLDKLVYSQEPFSESMRKSIILGIAMGMNHLHCEGVIHRDLASRNVLLTQNYKAKISDFGLSRENSADVNVTTVVVIHDSLLQSEVGPLKWMAPENIRDRMYSFKSDVWSFAVTLVEIYTRAMPYPSLAALSVASRVSTGELVPDRPEFASLVIREIIQQCSEYKPASRPSFQEIVDKLSASFNNSV